MKELGKYPAVQYWPKQVARYRFSFRQGKSIKIVKSDTSYLLLIYLPRSVSLNISRMRRKRACFPVAVNSSQLEYHQKVPKGCALLRTTLALVLAVSEILVLSSGPAFLPPPQNFGEEKWGVKFLLLDALCSGMLCRWWRWQWHFCVMWLTKGLVCPPACWGNIWFQQVDHNISLHCSF